MSSGSHGLETILQTLLATEKSTIQHLPNILQSLSYDPELISIPSNHRAKWMARVVSLLSSSKDPGARWAGFCIAKKTAQCLIQGSSTENYSETSNSRTLLLEYAPGWIGTGIAVLLKPEPFPVYKAAIDLLTYIFSVTAHLSEFKRQVLTPAVPKFSAALIALLEKQDTNLKNICISSLAQTIQLFPTIHRPLSESITSVCRHILSNSVNEQQSTLLCTANLLATLHVTDGKAGSSIAWRNIMDSVISIAYISLKEFATLGEVKVTSRPQLRKGFDFPPFSNDPLVAIPSAVNRLRNMVTLIDALLRVNPARPVSVPVEELAQLSARLLKASQMPEKRHHDVIRNSLEERTVPSLRELGCKLSRALAISLRDYLTPHSTDIFSGLLSQLDQSSTIQRLEALEATHTLLEYTSNHNSYLPSRLFALTSRIISKLLPSLHKIKQDSDISTTQNGISKSKKGKKRAREFEGEEILSGEQEALFQDGLEAAALLKALDVFRLVLRMPYLPASSHSIGTRLILSVSLSLSHQASSWVSPSDATIHSRIQTKLLHLQTELCSGSAAHAWRGLNLTLVSLDRGSSDTPSIIDSLREIDLLIHPKLPAPLRNLPKPESLMLFRDDETKEEREVREGLSLSSGLQAESDEQQPPGGEMMEVDDVVRPAAALEQDIFPSNARIQHPIVQENIAPPTVPAISGLQSPVTLDSNPVESLQREVQVDTKPNSPLSAWVEAPSTSLPFISNINPTTSTAGESSVPKIPSFDPDQDDDEEMPTIDMESDSE